MEQIINIHVERQPEGVYLATSEDVPGLVAQGRTVTETMEIARDVARKILEAQAERRENPTLPVIGDSFDCALVGRCIGGRLSGFRYREIVGRLKAFGFAFDRQAAGSHEIWYNEQFGRFTTIPNHPGAMPEGTPGYSQTSRYHAGRLPAEEISAEASATGILPNFHYALGDSFL